MTSWLSLRGVRQEPCKVEGRTPIPCSGRSISGSESSLKHSKIDQDGSYNPVSDRSVIDSLWVVKIIV